MAFPLKFGMAKIVPNPAQFLTTFDFVREYLRNGSTNRKSKKYFINYSPSYVGDKKTVNFGPQTKKLLTCILTHPSGHCSGARLYFGPYGVICPQIFIRATDCRRLANAHPNWDGGPPTPNDDENLKFGLKVSVCAPITSVIVGIF